MRCLLFEMSCEFLNEVVDEYLTFHQTRMLPERKIPIPKRNSNMSEQMLLGNGNISQELGSYQTTSSAFSVIWKSKYCTVYQCIDIMMCMKFILSTHKITLRLTIHYYTITCGYVRSKCQYFMIQRTKVANSQRA